MRWPFMLKKTHDDIVAIHIDDKIAIAEDADERLKNAREEIDAEYERALKDGMAKVHAWARDVTWELFTADNQNPKIHIHKLQSAMQQAEKKFNPNRL